MAERRYNCFVPIKETLDAELPETIAAGTVLLGVQDDPVDFIGTLWLNLDQLVAFALVNGEDEKISIHVGRVERAFTPPPDTRLLGVLVTPDAKLIGVYSLESVSSALMGFTGGIIARRATDSDLYKSHLSRAQIKSDGSLSPPRVGPSSEILFPITRVHPLLGFVDKLSATLQDASSSSEISLQLFDRARSYLVQRTNIFDDLAFRLGDGKEALRFAVALAMMETKSDQSASSAIGFAVCARRSPERRLGLSIMAHKDLGDGSTEISAAPSEELTPFQTIAYFAVLSVEIQKLAGERAPRSIHTLLGLWYTDDRDPDHSIGELAVEFALRDALVVAIMAEGDQLFDPFLLLGRFGLDLKCRRWLTPSDGTEGKMYTRTKEVYDTRTWEASISNNPLSRSTPPRPRSKSKPHFGSSINIALLPEVSSLSTVEQDTPATRAALGEAMEKAFPAPEPPPLPILYPGLSDAMLFLMYKKNLRQSNPLGRAEETRLRYYYEIWLKNAKIRDKRLGKLARREEREKKKALENLPNTGQ